MDNEELRVDQPGKIWNVEDMENEQNWVQHFYINVIYAFIHISWSILRRKSEMDNKGGGGGR